jgi:L-alanine-DL-glutamate epimerase-like enolase superfamily enzyme
MAHLATATPGVGAEEFPCDILGPIAYEEDLLVEPLEVCDGAVRAPDKPGLGVELDENKLARYRVA